MSPQRPFKVVCACMLRASSASLATSVSGPMTTQFCHPLHVSFSCFVKPSERPKPTREAVQRCHSSACPRSLGIGKPGQPNWGGSLTKKTICAVARAVPTWGKTGAGLARKKPLWGTALRLEHGHPGSQGWALAPLPASLRQPCSAASTSTMPPRSVLLT